MAVQPIRASQTMSCMAGVPGAWAHLQLGDVALQALHCQLVARILGPPQLPLLLQRCRQRLHLHTTPLTLLTHIDHDLLLPGRRPAALIQRP